mmetsp:Transcript_96065/g.240776  ORF Transcript_96065/g.240776 Transcript_96065/m.240776 type:complete len:259 (+) Transcript_96065:529-1305(+)
MLHKAPQPCSCRTGSPGCARRASVTASNAPTSDARCRRPLPAVSPPMQMMRMPPQAFANTPESEACLLKATTKASRAPTLTASCFLRKPAASTPKERLHKAAHPDSWTAGLVGCARNVATIDPILSAACSLPSRTSPCCRRSCRNITAKLCESSSCRSWLLSRRGLTIKGNVSVRSSLKIHVTAGISIFVEISRLLLRDMQGDTRLATWHSTGIPGSVATSKYLGHALGDHQVQKTVNPATTAAATAMKLLKEEAPNA